MKKFEIGSLVTLKDGTKGEVVCQILESNGLSKKDDYILEYGRGFLMSFSEKDVKEEI